MQSAFLPAGQPVNALFENPLTLLLATDAPFDDQLSNDLGRVTLGGSGDTTLAFGADDVVRFGITGNASFACTLRLKRAANEKLEDLDAYLPPGLDYRKWLVITLAVAGFAEADLTVEVVGNQLLIQGKQRDEAPGRVFLHRGIAARQFQRTFILADGIVVEGARLDNGLLSIDIFRPKPDAQPRTVKIASAKRGQVKESATKLDLNSR